MTRRSATPVAVLATVLMALALAVGPVPAAGAGARGPVVRQLVAFDSGKVAQRRVRAAAVRVRVGGRRCAVARGTALAALLRSRPGPIGLTDYSRCTRRARDAGGLYVRSIRTERARGLSGWVYKVGRRLATAGAGDPSGSFGSGRLRARQRVTWFFCRIRQASCQRTLEAKSRAVSGGLTVSVRGYDDDGRGIAVQGATVRAGAATALTDAAGRATLAIEPGSYLVRAVKRGLVASFRERVIVRP